MFKAKNIFIPLCVLFSILCLISVVDAAKGGGGGCKDRDGDGYFQKEGCGSAVDCDDTDATINPDATEICDGIDNNCDGTVDEGCGGCTDNDGDGYGNGPDCLGPDCDDNDAGANPGSTEVCDDGIDNNCDGTVDEGCGGCTPSANKEKGCDCFDNSDNDCDGSIDSLDRDCRNQTCDTCFDDDGDGWYTCGGDCDDTNAAVNPGAQEVCNGIDDNCDGSLPVEELDMDADGVSICEGDCDDYNPNKYPGNTEGPFGDPSCSDALDNDCDFHIDGSDSGCENPCTDLDGDGYGVNGNPFCFNVGIDCNDSDATIHPGADDSNCDGIDDDCDGSPDDDYVDMPFSCDPFGCSIGLCQCIDGIEICDCPPPGIEGPPGDPTCFDTLDNDCDGAVDGADSDCVSPICDSDGDGYCGSCTDGSCIPGDCDDNDPLVNPGGDITICDGKDTNCDGFLDFPDDRDADGDGVPACAECDDNDPNRSPNILEGPFTDPTCHDGIDNDCDYLVDFNDPDCAYPAPPHDVIWDCNYCHVGGDYSIPIPDSQCDQCHTPDGSLKGAFPTAPNVLTHSDANGSGSYTFTINCIECHNPMDSQTNLKNVRSIITGSIVPGSNIVFTAFIGAGSFADGPPYEENICETCHGLTIYHQSDGTAPGGQSHFDGEDCTTCHLHEDGFVAGIIECFGPHDAITDCSNCHIASPDFADPIPNSACNQCHAPGADPIAPDVMTHSSDIYIDPTTGILLNNDCVDCHTDHCNSNNLKLVRSTIPGSVVNGSQIIFTSYSGPGSFADGPPYEENICETCHSMTNHHQADGTAPGGQSHNDGTNCTACHTHLDGYSMNF